MHLRLAAIAGLGFAMIAPAMADTIKITVPVDVKALLPIVDNVSAGCIIYDAAGKEIATKWAQFKAIDATRALKTNFEISFDLPTGGAAKVATYKCGLSISTASHNTNLDGLHGTQTPGVDEFKPKPGAPLLTQTTGKVQ